MSTSGGGLVNAVLYLVALALSVQVGLLILQSRVDDAPHLWSRRSPFVSAGVVWALVAVPSLLQIPFPGLLRALRRDPELVLHHGQVWRVLTGLVVQDGGIGGTVFNLVILAVVALVAGQVWGPWRMPVVFLLAHLLFAIPAVFLSADVGAGNSGATFGLAATMAGLGLMTARTPGVVATQSPEVATARTPGVATARMPGVTARATGIVVIGIVLMVMADAHGIPIAFGVPLGALAADPPLSRRSYA